MLFTLTSDRGQIKIRKFAVAKTSAVNNFSSKVSRVYHVHTAISHYCNKTPISRSWGGELITTNRESELEA